MSVAELAFHRFRTIGWPGRLLVATCIAAAFNYGEIVFQMVTSQRFVKTGDFTLIVCRLGPPPSLYPRFIVACSLLIATISILRRPFPRSPITVIGAFAALVVYGYWWLKSYRLFSNLADEHIAFINNPEIRQTAYLYGGTWLDAGIAASVVVCSVLLADRFINARRHPPD